MKGTGRNCGNAKAHGTCADMVPYRVIAAFVASILLAFSLAFSPVSAYAADVDPQTQAALQELEEAFEQAYQAQSSGEQITDDETPLAASPDAVEEEILDEENPLAASPYAAPVFDFVWVLLAVIVAIAGFFFVSTRRLDKNINQMRHFVD